jgi:hypothetical protein
MWITDNEDLTELIASAKNRLKILRRQQEEDLEELAAANKTVKNAQEALLHNLQKSAMDEINALQAAVDAALFNA